MVSPHKYDFSVWVRTEHLRTCPPKCSHDVCMMSVLLVETVIVHSEGSDTPRTPRNCPSHLRHLRPVELNGFDVSAGSLQGLPATQGMAGTHAAVCVGGCAVSSKADGGGPEVRRVMTNNNTETALHPPYIRFCSIPGPLLCRTCH